MHYLMRLSSNPRFRHWIFARVLKITESKVFLSGSSLSAPTFRPFTEELNQTDDDVHPSTSRLWVPSARTGLHPMRIPNGGLTFEEIKTNVDRMLEDFRNRRRHGGTSSVRHATYLCNITGRFEEFLEVMDEWFRQVRPLLDQQPYFKSGSNLCNLGKLNRCTNGRVIGRLEWKSIDYFIQRMLEMGFHRFHAEDVGSALAGLHDLVFYTEILPNRISIEKSIDGWLQAFGRYIMEKQRTDADWSVLIREVAPFSLNYMKGLDSCRLPIFDRHRSLIETLLRLSKLGFDEILGEIAACRAMEKESAKQVVYESGITTYAQAVVYFDLEPEQVAPGTWTSWFDCYAMLLKRFSKTFTFLDYSYAVQIAGKYADFRSSHFWPKFDIWYTDLVELIRQFLIDPGSSINSHKKAASLFYNTGIFLKQAKYDDEFQRRKYEFRILASLFDQILSGEESVDGRSLVWQSRILCAFRDFNRALGTKDAYKISDNFYDRLRDWCVRKRETAGEYKGNELLSGMASVAHLLIDQQPPTSVLEEVAISFYEGLGQYQDNDVSFLLHLYALACLELNFDPSRINRKDYPLDDFWSRYYQMAKKYLADDRENEQGRDRDRLWKLLVILPELAVKFGRINEFRDLKEIYEERLEKHLDFMTPGGCLVILGRINTLVGIARECKLKISLMEKLKSKTIF